MSLAINLKEALNNISPTIKPAIDAGPMALFSIQSQSHGLAHISCARSPVRICMFVCECVLLMFTYINPNAIGKLSFSVSSQQPRRWKKNGKNKNTQIDPSKCRWCVNVYMLLMEFCMWKTGYLIWRG